MASCIPVPVEEEIVEVHMQLNTEKLGDVLGSLSNAISRNGKALMALMEEVGEVKKSVETSAQRVEKMNEYFENQTLELSSEIASLKEKVRTVSSTTVTLSEFNKDREKMGRSITRAEQFIDELEKGGGERVQKFVRQYVETFVPKWYESVSGPLWDRIRNAIELSRDNSARYTDQQTIKATNSLQEVVKETKAEIVTKADRNNEDRRHDILSMRTVMEEGFSATTRHIAAMGANMKAELQTVQAANVQRMNALEHTSDVLHTIFCMEKEACEDLYQLVGGEHATNDFTVGLQEAEEPRVEALHRTPPFLSLRAKVQAELNERAEHIRRQVQEDFSKEMTEVEKELKSKVNSAKLGEAIAELKDTNLYNNVKTLLFEVNDIKANKVDSAQFVDALKSKVDMKGLEVKADKSQMMALLSGTSNRVEELEAQMQKAMTILKTQEVMLQETQLSNDGRKQLIMPENLFAHPSQSLFDRSNSIGSGFTTARSPRMAKDAEANKRTSVVAAETDTREALRIGHPEKFPGPTPKRATGGTPAKGARRGIVPPKFERDHHEHQVAPVHGPDDAVPGTKHQTAPAAEQVGLTAGQLAYTQALQSSDVGGESLLSRTTRLSPGKL